LLIPARSDANNALAGRHVPVRSRTYAPGATLGGGNRRSLAAFSLQDAGALIGGSMVASNPAGQELKDIELKLQSAREAAGKAGASEKDKADLKLIEQEYMAAQQKERRQPSADRRAPPLEGKKALDKKLDDALKGSFPGSDPVSFVEAAPVKEQDRSLPEVKVGEQQQPEKTEAAKKSEKRS